MNPWSPVKDPLTLKQLGKLAEESSELSTVVSRCIIQGVEEVEPVTKKPNRLWLEEEVADVIASMRAVIEGQGLDQDFIMQRAEMKYQRLQQWHRLPTV